MSKVSVYGLTIRPSTAETEILFENGLTWVVDLCHGIEIFFLLLHHIFPAYYIYLSIKRPIVHYNLFIIMSFAVAISYPMAYARLWLIACEQSLISIDEFPHIVATASVIRIWHIFCLFYCILAAIAERLFASILSRDYEKSKRSYISIILIFLMNICAMISCFLHLTDLVSLFTFGIYIIAVLVLVLPVIVKIYRLNIKAREEMERSRNYSLSRRYQINENLRIIRLTAHMIVLSLFLVVSIAILIFIRVYFTPLLFQGIMSISYEVCLTLVPIVEYAVIFLTFREWRSHLFGIFGSRRIDNANSNLTGKILILSLFLASIIAVLIFCRVYVTSQIVNDAIAMFYQIFITIVPLLIFSTIILTFREWRGHLLGLFGMKRKTSAVSPIDHQKITDEHFRTLYESWNKETI